MAYIYMHATAALGTVAVRGEVPPSKGTQAPKQNSICKGSGAGVDWNQNEISVLNIL